MVSLIWQWVYALQPLWRIVLSRTERDSHPNQLTYCQTICYSWILHFADSVPRPSIVLQSRRVAKLLGYFLCFWFTFGFRSFLKRSFLESNCLIQSLYEVVLKIVAFFPEKPPDSNAESLCKPAKHFPKISSKFSKNVLAKWGNLFTTLPHFAAFLNQGLCNLSAYHWSKTDKRLFSFYCEICVLFTNYCQGVMGDNCKFVIDTAVDFFLCEKFFCFFPCLCHKLSCCRLTPTTTPTI